MAKKQTLDYKRVTPNDIKVSYSSGDKHTEVLARVVTRGTYFICDKSSQLEVKHDSSESSTHSE